MSKQLQYKFPVGRLIGGSLSTPVGNEQKKTFQKGPNAGAEYKQYYFYVAFEKNGERDWKETEWGKLLYNFALEEWQTVAHSPTFSFKVADGDSTIPNSKGIRQCDQPGAPGNWVVRFSSGFPPKMKNHNASQDVEASVFNLGDYVEVYATIKSNGSKQSPGMILNPIQVCHRHVGERIILSTATFVPDDVKFGEDPLPRSALQYTEDKPETPAVPNSTPVVPPTTPVVPTAGQDVPWYQKYKMTPKAKDLSYESFKQNPDWTDELLLQHGYIERI